MTRMIARAPIVDEKSDLKQFHDYFNAGSVIHGKQFPESSHPFEHFHRHRCLCILEKDKEILNGEAGHP